MSPDAPNRTDLDAGAAAMLARASVGDALDARRLDTAIEDVFLPEDGRLDDEARAGLRDRIARAVEAVERDIVVFAERASGERLTPGVLGRLVASGLLRDRRLFGEVIGRTRQDFLGDALRTAIPPADQSNLLARLVDCPDAIVAAAATALLAAENRVRHGRPDLSTSVHERLVWWVAAALRERAQGDANFDRALAEAAARSIAAHRSIDSLDRAAMRLAAAIDPQPDELADLLIGALADARPALFFAALAHAAHLDMADARAIVTDLDGDRLWLILRDQGLERAEIARIGLMLGEADRRRDLEAFADLLDSIAAIDRDEARGAVAPMRFHPEFRAALRALAATREP